MREKRLIFGSSALLAVASFLGINGYYWWSSESDRSQSPPTDLSASDEYGSTFPGLVPLSSTDWPNAEEGNAPHHALHRETQLSPTLGYFPEHAETVEMAQADLPGLEPSTTCDSPKPKPPRLLPDTAAPIAETDWLRELVRKELPDAGVDEVRIWSQELEGLGPEMARDILRMRKNVANSPSSPQLGAIPRQSPEWNAVPEPAPNGMDRLVPQPLDESPAIDPLLADQLIPSIEAFEQSRRVFLHNLVNAHTPGFKRSRIVLSSRLSASESDESIDGQASATVVNPGEGVELAATLLDMSQGRIRRTGKQLDLAIDGAGLFQVRIGEDLLYTRSGMGGIDAQGRLCLINGGKLCPLEPPIHVTDEIQTLAIDEFGQVKAAIPGHDQDLSDAREIGQIQLARFTNAAGLKPRGGQLYAATKTSGPPKTGRPGFRGFGKTLQGQLEQSNVSRDDELEEFNRIQAHWQLLDQLAKSPASDLIPGPVAQRPVLRAQRASAVRDPLISPAMKSFKSLRDQGTNLIEEYLQSERVKSLKRNLGLN